MRKIVKDLPYQVNQRAFLALICFKTGKSTITETMYKRMKRAVEKAKSVIEPRGVYALYRIESVLEEMVVLENRISLAGRSISTHCKGFSHVYLMAVTIGEKIDKLIEESPVEMAMIIDAYGSEAVEGVAESLNKGIEREAVHFGLVRFNWRFSPGYGDLPLSTNLLFERALAMEDIGIRVMENLSLSPRKSITAIIPAGG